MDDRDIYHAHQHQNPGGAARQTAVFKGVVQRDDAHIKEQQHQLGGQTRIPHPPGAPHRLAPGGAGYQRDKVNTAPIGAIAATTVSDIFICHTRPINAATAIEA